MSIVISLLNHKGGVGKTTSAANIGAGLALAGKRVLMIDLDPQANLTLCFGMPRHPKTIYEALRGESELVPYRVKDNLDIVIATIDLSGAEMELINEAGREFILREVLNPLVDQYDVIIIDCPPSLALLTFNALAASQYVIIPLQTQFLALQGLAKINQVINKVKLRINPELKIGGVVPTMYDGRKLLNREVVETIHKYFGDSVFKTFIRSNVALAEAPAHKQDIFAYAPNSAGSEDYKALCQEIIQRLEI